LLDIIKSLPVFQIEKDAKELARVLTMIGNEYNKVVIPVLSDMNMPLGDNIGNVLEVIEAIDVLKGKTGNLRDLCINLSTILYEKAKKVPKKEAKQRVIEVIENGKAYDKFLEFVKNQGGDIDKIQVSKYITSVKARSRGTLNYISAEKAGNLVLKLGGGRVKKNDKIDYKVGLVINKHLGDKIKDGDVLCYIYQNDKTDYRKEALKIFTIN